MTFPRCLLLLLLVTSGACDLLEPRYPAQAADREALVALYNSTGGPRWARNTNWLTDAPLGAWEGVKTDWTVPDSAGRVERLYLDGYGLRGPIPPEFGDLTKLRIVVFWFNQLSGQIPPEMGNLADLEVLEIAGNRLSGQIPPELGSMRNLMNFLLPDNSLTGPIPPELGNFRRMRLFDLSGNNLTGSIPPELGRLATMARLRLQHNGLTGTVPPELGDLGRLRVLDLSHNSFAGELPASLTRLNLDVLYWEESGLCAPADAAFQEWLAGVERTRGPACQD